MSQSVVVSMARLRRAWVDPKRTTPQIAADLGLNRWTVAKIAKREGWPPRSRRNRQAKLTIEAIRPLWEAGLCCRDIGAALGATTNAVSLFVWRFGMSRGKGWRPKITLAEWQDQQAAEAMAALAAKERAEAIQRAKDEAEWLRDAA